MREKTFENKVKSFLNSKGCWVVKYFGNAYSQNGVPDLLCCVNGYFVAVEVKAETGRPTKLQEVTIERIRDAGGYAFILYPDGFEMFQDFICHLLED